MDDLNIIDTSYFTGSQKLWFLQHLLIPRIQWPLFMRFQFLWYPSLSKRLQFIFESGYSSINLLQVCRFALQFPRVL